MVKIVAKQDAAVELGFTFRNDCSTPVRAPATILHQVSQRRTLHEKLQRLTPPLASCQYFLLIIIPSYQFQTKNPHRP